MASLLKRSAVVVGIGGVGLAIWIAVMGLQPSREDHAVNYLRSNGADCLGGMEGIHTSNEMLGSADVVALDLSSVKMGPRVKEAVRQLKGVYSIRVEGQIIYDEWWDTIAASQNLELLALEDCNLRTYGAENLRKCQKLHLLSIRRSVYDEEVFKVIVQVSTIRTLILDDGRVQPSWLASLTSLPNLETVHLRGVDVGMKHLQALATAPQIRRIIVSDTLYSPNEDFIQEIMQARPELAILPR